MSLFDTRELNKITFKGLTPEPVQSIQQFAQIQSGAGNTVFKATRDGVFAGAASYGDAPWKVSYAGIMQAVGAIIYSDASGDRVAITSGKLGIYSGATLVGSIKRDGSNMVVGTESGGGSFFMMVNGANIVEVSATALKPNVDGGISLGTSLKRFNEGNFSGGITCGSISCGSITAGGTISGNCSGNHSGSFSGSVAASGGVSGSYEFMQIIRIDVDPDGHVKTSGANGYYKQRTVTFTSGIVTGVSDQSTVNQSEFLT